jgi:Mg2+/Co2+ transporter CorB
MITTLIITIVILLIVSGFFSGSETSMMSLNRYRLRHLAKHNHKRAITSQKLLQRPDKLLATILLGNTLANNLATFFTTIIAQKYFGSFGAAIATLILTLMILLFAETIPKTLAALYPEKFAFLTCEILNIIKIIGLPLILSLNAISNAMLLPFGIKVKNKAVDPISKEELRSLVTDSSSDALPKPHRTMLLGVLDLELTTLKDVMVPRHQIQAMSLSSPWPKILKQIQNSPFSKLLIYEENIDNITGVLSLRKVNKLITQSSSKAEKNHSSLYKKNIISFISKPYFVPEMTTLQDQLIAFQHTGYDLAIVVDEYGDIQGLVTIRDILEEIVGELDQKAPLESRSIVKQKDGSYIVQGYISAREINRHLQIELPLDKSKTLSGLITQHLDALPSKNTSLMIKNYPIEILQVKGKTVKKAKIHLENKN